MHHTEVSGSENFEYYECKSSQAYSAHNTSRYDCVRSHIEIIASADDVFAITYFSETVYECAQMCTIVKYLGIKLKNSSNLGR